MKHITQADIMAKNTRYRANLINGLSGYKPANLIGTKNKDGVENLAIFSSIVHLGAHPPLMGFIMRPAEDVPRNTFQNILDTEYFTINHIHASFYKAAHQTSAKYPQTVSEYSECGLTPEYINGFYAPYLAESKIKIGLKFIEALPIKHNNTSLVIGEIQHIILPENILEENGNINLHLVDDVCITGLDTYNTVSKMETLEYARVK